MMAGVHVTGEGISHNALEGLARVRDPMRLRGTRRSRTAPAPVGYRVVPPQDVIKMHLLDGQQQNVHLHSFLRLSLLPMPVDAAGGFATRGKRSQGRQKDHIKCIYCPTNRVRVTYRLTR